MGKCSICGKNLGLFDGQGSLTYNWCDSCAKKEHKKKEEKKEERRKKILTSKIFLKLLWIPVIYIFIRSVALIFEFFYLISDFSNLDILVASISLLVTFCVCLIAIKDGLRISRGAVYKKHENKSTGFMDDFFFVDELKHAKVLTIALIIRIIDIVYFQFVINPWFYANEIIIICWLIYLRKIYPTEK